MPVRRSTPTTRTPRPALRRAPDGDPRSPLTSGPTRSPGALRPGRPAASSSPTMSCSGVGLTRNRSQPAASARLAVSAPTCPESASTGMWRVRTSAFSRRVASKPSTPGSDRSMRIAAGIVSSARSSASLDGAGDGDAVAADAQPLGVHLARIRDNRRRPARAVGRRSRLRREYSRVRGAGAISATDQLRFCSWLSSSRSTSPPPLTCRKWTTRSTRPARNSASATTSRARRRRSSSTRRPAP